MSNGYTIDHTVDEFGNDRYFVANPAGDWVGDPHDTHEAAAEWIKDAEPWGAGADPFGRPDPQTNPEFWTE